MPLRVTVEIIPRGDESRKAKLAQIEIKNDCTLGDKRGGGGEANYDVRASAELEGGYDEFAAFTMGPLKRGNYLDTVIAILSVMHSTKMPRTGGCDEDNIRMALRCWNHASRQTAHC